MNTTVHAMESDRFPYTTIAGTRFWRQRVRREVRDPGGEYAKRDPAATDRVAAYRQSAAAAYRQRSAHTARGAASRGLRVPPPPASPLAEAGRAPPWAYGVFPPTPSDADSLAPRYQDPLDPGGRRVPRHRRVSKSARPASEAGDPPPADAGLLWAPPPPPPEKWRMAWTVDENPSSTRCAQVFAEPGARGSTAGARWPPPPYRDHRGAVLVEANGGIRRPRGQWVRRPGCASASQSALQRSSSGPPPAWPSTELLWP